METYHKIVLAAIFIFVIRLSFLVAHAQSNEKPCSHSEASQFDFWVGEWNLSWKAPDGTNKTGTNIINKILGGCVIEENFTTGDSSLIGKSYSVYNPNKKIWQQTWIDNNGGYLDFTGGMDGDKMILWRKAITKAGKEAIQRMVFYEISTDKFYWNWENSTDEGTTWNVVWHILYTRKS